MTGPFTPTSVCELTPSLLDVRSRDMKAAAPALNLSLTVTVLPTDSSVVFATFPLVILVVLVALTSTPPNCGTSFDLCLLACNYGIGDLQ